MRTFPGVKISAFSDPDERIQIKVIHDYLRDVSGGLSHSLQLGTRPLANITASAPVVTSDPSRETIVNTVYPVGSIYISTTSTNPGISLGVGTWVAFGTGKVMVGLDGGDTDFQTPEQTGGAKTVASAGTVGPIAATLTGAINCGTGVPPEPASDQVHTHPAPTFTGTATSVVQPYIVVLMWKRTA